MNNNNFSSNGKNSPINANICHSWTSPLLPLVLMKHNIEKSHSDFNTANFKIIDKYFSNNKRNHKNAESFSTSKTCDQH